MAASKRREAERSKYKRERTFLPGRPFGSKQRKVERQKCFCGTVSMVHPVANINYHIVETLVEDK